MLSLNKLIDEMFAVLMRSLTGRLFTDSELHRFTSHAIGRYFSEWFPEPERDRQARERVEEARNHISRASSIIAGMQSDLESQTEQLNKLLEEIDEKKELADRYARLADTNQEKFAAFREEMEEALRNELIQQSEQGKKLRRVASITIWFITLILGAALGAYFKDIVKLFG
jgi:hypothetical protein